MDIPRTFFRHCSVEAANDLVERGIFWIGSYSGMKVMEAGGDRRDAMEGTLVVDGTWDGSSERSIGSFAPRGFVSPVNAPAGTDCVVEDLEFGYETPDASLYCVSALGTEAVTRRFEKEACVEITDAPAFFTAMGEALADRFGLSDKVPRFGVCQYGPDVYSLEAGADRAPWLVKREHFAWQAEWRAAWWPHWSTNSLEPQRLESSEIAKYVVRVR